MDKPQRLARRAEQDTARLHGGRVTPGSGNVSGTKNDVRNPEWSFEVKSTSQKGYRLEAETLIQAEKNAQRDGRRMALVVAFVGRLSTRHRRYVVLNEDDFIEREQELAELRAYKEHMRVI